MKLIFERNSLSSQVFKALREGVSSGTWSERLPGERRLCELLHVSRTTVRVALRELEREGLIEVEHRRRSRIVVQNGSVAKPTVSKVVSILSAVPFHMLRPFAMFLVDEIRSQLGEAGYRLEFQTGSRLYGQHPHKVLETLVQEKPAACWVLFQAPRQIQTWFADHRLPAVVLGSPHSGVDLPSVEVDYRATCRHACGILLARGHRRIVLLIENFGCAGEEESTQGFLESARSMARFNARLSIVSHNGTVAAVCAKLDHLLRSKDPPTAFLVANSMYVMTVVGHLLRSGLRVPDDVAVISRDDDSFLAYSVPSVDRYSCVPAHFACKAAQLILQVVRGEPVISHRMFLMPDFVKAETPK